ncbi:MAG TPA: efflux RND transporter permease subunit, partial [Verrucomicrobiae bacterium]
IEHAGLLPTGYRLEWTGQYEYMLRVRDRLKAVVPLTLMLIFVLLYLNFKSIAETFIILLSIPFAMTGSIWLLWLLNYNLSIAVWVGIIALAGLAAQTGTIMIIYLDEAFHAYQRAGRMNTQHDLFEAITYGAVQRVRPKLMTVCMITLGLVPALWAHGAGSEAIQRIAAPMIGGLITSTILTLEIVPAIYSLWRGRQVQWVKGPSPRRKSWNELNAEFVVMERAEHGGELIDDPHAVSETSTDSKAQPRRSKTVWLVIALMLAAIVAGWAIWKSANPAKHSPAPAHSHLAPASTETNANHFASVSNVTLTPAQRDSVSQLLRVGNEISASLSSDDLAAFNHAQEELESELQHAIETLGEEYPWTGFVQPIRVAGLKPAGDLDEARAEFISFSAALVNLAQAARSADSAFSGVKIYRCPMAPKPGFWMQLQPPLRNPYFGAEMLDCGTEIAP